MTRIPANVLASLPRKLGPAPKPLPLDFVPTDAQARSLYRQLWRMGSLSVMHTNPERRVIRAKIREGFEETKKLQTAMSPEDVRRQWDRAHNTLFFFEIATTRFGIEHKVISNIAEVSFANRQSTLRIHKASIKRAQKTIDNEYSSVIRALNDSMNLCLR